MTKRKITNGSSSENSVSFFLEGVSNGVEAIRREDGTIEIREIHLKSSSDLIVCSVICGFFREFSFHLNGPKWFYYGPTVVWVLIFLILVVQISREQEKRMYHGAEHKVANWYKRKKGGEGIDIVDIERCSRIHKCCGTNIMSTIVTLQLVSAICMFWFNFHIPEYMTIVVSLCIYDVFPFNLLGMFMQLFTTATPTRKHIYVAVRALTTLLEKSK